MQKIDIESWNRKKNYLWFKSFSNSTYSTNVNLDVTNLVNISKKEGTSFFINMLYIVVNGLNSIEEMRMRLVNDEPVIFEDISPAYTVLMQNGEFENVRHSNPKNYLDFYNLAKSKIDKAKSMDAQSSDDYNPQDKWDEYYITCLPWINFTQFTHPIPDNVSSQCIPRICWGKYEEKDGKYFMNFNITVSHIFVDGYKLSNAVIKIQELINMAKEVLK